MATVSVSDGRTCSQSRIRCHLSSLWDVLEMGEEDAS